MKSLDRKQSIRLPRTVSATAVLLKLDRQHKRWLLSQNPGYQAEQRERDRRKRRKQIERKRKFAAFKRRHPRLVWLGDLFATAFLIFLSIAMAWFLYELILFERNKNGVRTGSGNVDELKAVFDLFAGWMLMSIPVANLFLLWVFWVDPFRKLHVPIRHVVLKQKYHWFALAVFGVYCFPISFSAESFSRWLLAIAINFLMVSAASVSVRSAGIGIIAFRNNHRLMDEKQRMRSFGFRVFAAFGILIAAFVCLAVYCRALGLEPISPLRFLQNVSTGEASMSWIAGSIAASAILLGVALCVELKLGSYGFRRRIVRSLRFKGEVSVSDLENLAMADEPISSLEVRQAIRTDFTEHNSKLGACLNRLLRFDPILLVWIPVFLIAYGCIGGLLNAVGQADIEVRQSAGIPDLNLVLGFSLLLCWATIESAEWVRFRSRMIRSCEARMLTPMRRWVRLQADGVATFAQTCLLYIPFAGIAYWRLGNEAVSYISFALAMLAMTHVATRNIASAFGVLSQVRTLLPKIPLGELAGILSSIPLFGALAGLGLILKEYGATGMFVIIAALFGVSWLLFAVSIAVRYSITQPCK